MDKALTPYVKGGGAKKYEEELKRIYGADGSFTGNGGAFSAMTQDALTVLNDIPFSIPPYFALLARAIVTLEGIALTGNPNYGIILESYPFVARKLLSEDRPVSNNTTRITHILLCLHLFSCSSDTLSRPIYTTMIVTYVH